MPSYWLTREKKNSSTKDTYMAIAFFISKCIQSMSQRQWFFRSRLVRLKVSSLLLAAIYNKQLRLSNSARLMHSGAEIMNYVTVDAYRIGEFPFWFHQTWTTILQLCFALLIHFRAVGLATIAALVVIILTVLCNIPLAKLQQKFQSKLIVAQDERLKASSESLVKVEHKWLYKVQSGETYKCILFWSTPVLISSATLGACYFLRVPLHANNVFTFVATFRLVQDPIVSIPDIIGVVIHAKLAFAHIIKFLEAPELQNAHVQNNSNMENVNHSIFINSAKFSWPL